MLAGRRILVVDADGLNNLVDSKALLNKPASPRILTPHPGEAHRLTGLDIQDDRLNAVKTLQATLGGTVLLKGAGTLVADDSVSLCAYGNPGMSVAGMGDVLSGIVGSLLVQGLSRELACRLGCVVHSLAADIIVEGRGERGLLATELMPVVRDLLNRNL